MKKMKVMIAAAFSVMLLTACGTGKPAGGESAESTNEKAQVHKITAEEAKKMMDEGDVTIVDVRTQEEYEEAHVPNAIVIPSESIGEKEPEELSDKAAVIMVYCRSGRRSADAAEKLSKLGYENIYDFGGIIDWPYETEASGK